MRLLWLLKLDSVGLAVRRGLVVVVSVVALVRAAVIAALLGLRNVRRRGLIRVVAVVGLYVVCGPASAVERLSTGLATTAGGYTAENC